MRLFCAEIKFAQIQYINYLPLSARQQLDGVKELLWWDVEGFPSQPQH